LLQIVEIVDFINLKNKDSMNILLQLISYFVAKTAQKNLIGITYHEFEKEKSLFATIILEQNFLSETGFSLKKFWMNTMFARKPVGCQQKTI